MSKVTITPKNGRHFCELDGQPFGNPDGYKTRQTAIQKIRMSGHSFDKLPKGRKPNPNKPKDAKAPKADKPQVDWQAIAIASKRVVEIDGKISLTPFWNAFNVGKANVIGYETKATPGPDETVEFCVELYKWACHCANLEQFHKALEHKAEVPVIDLADAGEDEDTQVDAAPVDAKAELEATVAKAVEWNTNAANQAARDFGFGGPKGKRAYRALKRAHEAAPEGSAEKADLARMRRVCVTAATKAA